MLEAITAYWIFSYDTTTSTSLNIIYFKQKTYTCLILKLDNAFSKSTAPSAQL